MRKATNLTGLVKEKARELGANLVGVAAAATLEEHPPDPSWPQTPSRLWEGCRSVVIIALRIPWGMFLAQDRVPRQYTPHTIFARLDAISLDLAYFLEEKGFHAVPVPNSYTDTSLKRGTYGPLSFRHLAVEAGLGSLGLNLNLMTPQYGPRVYLNAVLTDAELAPDAKKEERLCLGPACGRCLLACPPDAIGYWSSDKRKCSTHAQLFGVAAFFRHLEKAFSLPHEERWSLIRGPETVNFWQALRTGTGSYGGCPRCLEVCPVGEDYAAHLKKRHASIPEATPEKEEKRRQMVAAEKKGEPSPTLQASLRWLGNRA